jgi:hypothetical protein
VKNQFFFDPFKIRPDFTEHTIRNNKLLTPNFGGQFDPDNYGQGELAFPAY